MLTGRGVARLPCGIGQVCHDQLPSLSHLVIAMESEKAGEMLRPREVFASKGRLDLAYTLRLPTAVNGPMGRSTGADRADPLDMAKVTFLSVQPLLPFSHLYFSH